MEERNRNDEPRFAVDCTRNLYAGICEQRAQPSAQTLPAPKLQLEDQQPEVSAVNSKSPGKIERRIVGEAGAAKHLGSVGGSLGRDGKPAPLTRDSFPRFYPRPALAAHTQAAGISNFTAADGARCGENNCEETVNQFLNNAASTRNGRQTRNESEPRFPWTAGRYSRPFSCFS